LFFELVRVGLAEVVADGGAADVQAQPGTLALEVGQVFRRGPGEVVGGQLDGFEVLADGEVDEIVEAHRRLALLRAELPVEAVGGDTQLEVSFAGAADRLNGRGRAGGEGEPGAGGDGAEQELTAG